MFRLVLLISLIFAQICSVEASDLISQEYFNGNIALFKDFAIQEFNKFDFKLSSLEFELACSLEPYNEVLRRRFMSSLMLEGQFPHAFAEFLIVFNEAKPTPYSIQELNALNTRIAAVYYSRACKLIFKQKWPQVIANLQKCNVHLPDDIKTMRLLAFAYNNNNQLELAQKFYAKCLSINPDDSSLRADFAYLLSDMGQSSKAFKEICLANKQSPSALAFYVDKAWMAMACHKYDEAQTTIGEALTKSPNSPGLWLQLGQIYQAQNKFSDAISAYHKVLQLEPNSIAANIYISKIAKSTKVND